MNKTMFIGRLTRDPELRYTTSGVAVTRFSIAVDRRFTNQQGEREADFINIVTWRGLAENCANYIKKGSLVAIDGRLQTGKYEKDGRTVYTTDIVAEDVRFLDSKGRNNESEKEFAGVSSQGMGADPFGDGKPIDISDDDLPF